MITFQSNSYNKGLHIVLQIFVIFPHINRRALVFCNPRTDDGLILGISDIFLWQLFSDIESNGHLSPTTDSRIVWNQRNWSLLVSYPGKHVRRTARRDMSKRMFNFAENPWNKQIDNLYYHISRYLIQFIYLFLCALVWLQANRN